MDARRRLVPRTHRPLVRWRRKRPDLAFRRRPRDTFFSAANSCSETPRVAPHRDRCSARSNRSGSFKSIRSNRAERAHHHILHSRFDTYRPAQLTTLLERDRSLFEHWTHDAAVIRSDWFPYWKHRFDAYHRSARLERWIKKRMGPDHERITRSVLRRITKEGPLTSRDFDDEKSGKPGGWWEWKPSRAALEMLWRVGKLSITGRRKFLKVYDRTERVFPELSRSRKPGPAQHRDWACRAAMERLGVATPTELAHLLFAVDRHTASDWAQRAARRRRNRRGRRRVGRRLRGSPCVRLGRLA